MPRAVFLDFYGTLARDLRPASALDDVLARRGYTIREELRLRWWHGDLDGTEHVEVSRSRDAYAAWERERLLGMLAEADVHPGERDVILAELRRGRAQRNLAAYPEVDGVLRALRAQGVLLVVCSNWDWDLEAALEEAGLDGAVDALVSSAWAGARKPHPRIFRHALGLAGLDAADVLFVGDTWGPDVEGPRAVGMCAAYLERDGHWPDPTLPIEPGRDVPRLADLTALPALLGG